MTNSNDLLKPPPRYAIDANRVYDLESTARIAQLLVALTEVRSDGWTQAFMEAAWNGLIEIPRTPFFEGPDGFRLALPSRT